MLLLKSTVVVVFFFHTSMGPFINAGQVEGRSKVMKVVCFCPNKKIQCTG